MYHLCLSEKLKENEIVTAAEYKGIIEKFLKINEIEFYNDLQK